MDAKAFRTLVGRLEASPDLLHNLLFEGATAPEIRELLSPTRAGSVPQGSEGALRQMMTPGQGRYGSLLDLAAASCDESVTCCCTSGTCAGVTCGGSTCSVTCSGDSCGNTCGDSCGMTTNFAARSPQEIRDPSSGPRQEVSWR